MKIKNRFPRKIRVIHHAIIPLSDGVALSAMIWLPEDAETNPVPAILEYLPYRKRDGTSGRDALNHPYFAGHGYAAVRVDMRGSGDSEGVLLGEYLKQEQDDALEILTWIAAQAWCSGSIGMIGISWGGFNGLQIAARRPSELKAVVSICSTDDRYADDIHSMGGCLSIDRVAWGSTMFAINATPPDPALVGDKWRDMWMQRLDKSGFWIEQWHRHQRRDDFHKHGSICEDYSAVQCPVYLVGGWADGYSNAIFRMLKNMTAPRKGLIGPWAHSYPNFAKPGPQIGFLQECLRWWDYWLKGEETGIMDEPMVRVWMQDTVAPKASYEERPGRWVAEDSWPSSRNETIRFPFAINKLAKPGSKPHDSVLEICSPQTIGMHGGKWCPYGVIPDLPGDQRQEAGGSLVFDSAPLKRPLEFMGTPVVNLDIASDKPDALIAVTLSEVLPDGAATRLTFGILNLTHRDGHENPVSLEPGKRYQVQIKLNDCAQRLNKGSRLRIALSTSYWPIVWPSPAPATLSISTGASSLELPKRPARAEDKNLRAFKAAECAFPLNATQIRPSAEKYQVGHVMRTGQATLEILGDDGMKHNNDTGWSFGSSCHRLFSITPDDPLSAAASLKWRKEYARGDWNVRIEADTHMTVTHDHFIITATLDAFEGDARAYSNQWNCRIPRDHT
ncbi:MAG: CocE/NonD family hydrolase [Alphaproteobacteria bacterium]|nr:CocE/NonD family hydrolase [Alphaproteobacteria bacterium]